MLQRNGVLIGVTDAVTADAFLRPHLLALKERDVETHLVASNSELLEVVARETGAKAWHLPMSRNPNLLRDVIALGTACRLLLRLRPAGTHVGTPKAGLVLGLAAAMTRVPKRIYTVHGLRYQTECGWRRRVLEACERAACAAATDVIAVSPSVAAELVSKGISTATKTRVLGSGSISGVCHARFKVDEGSGRHFRVAAGIPNEALVVLFVGRLTRDKGIEDLSAAWPQVTARVPHARLVVVGSVDVAQPALQSTLELLAGEQGVFFSGHLPDPAPAYAAADLLVLPSYREGFPTAILEAASTRVPAVACDVTGCRDAVLDGVTGKLAAPHDPEDLAGALVMLLSNADLRRRMGIEAQLRARREFGVGRVVDLYLAELVS